VSLRTEKLRQDQTVISLPKLHDLERKAANHDGYLAATLAMGVAMRKRQELARDARARNDYSEASYHLGWLDCINEYNKVVLDFIGRQMDAHPHLEGRAPSKVRKGQVCPFDTPGCYCLVAIR
jgi:hypothetical protein